MKNQETKHSWQAEEYHQNSQIQYDAAKELLSRIDLSQFQRVLDIGCGDGKITAQIASQLKTGGSILGVDISREMITFAAKKYRDAGHVDFRIQDAGELDFEDEFDLIFSSFAIQWVIDQKSLFLKIYQALSLKGHFVATIPLGISDALEQAIDSTLSSEKWSSYFENFVKTWNFYTSDEIKQAISKTAFDMVKFEVVFQEVWFQSVSKLSHYILQWFPYLKPLPIELRDEFFHEIIEKYIALEPLREDGSIRFRFPRLDIIANKVSP